ncbi:hypothetical protein [Polyangium mundeleinium]|uniref:Uncharacterized protein n=1 Tax=Polyangium mundeleinium TaxID=2995306 RepID=A0ABT5EG46_9BACT|nr:hypothetical protein [Polyangium mundeleinium]MDC0740790.1 hypothetical protein [Polyangium mundeleinium]
MRATGGIVPRMRYQLLVTFLLVSHAAACVSHDAQPAPGNDIDIVAPSECTTDVPDGEVVVGCDFGPGITPFAVGAGRVYVVSPSGTYSAIDLAAASTTRLFRYQFTATTTQLASSTVVRGDTLYFPGSVIEGGIVRTALMAFDAVTATPDGAAEIVAWGDRYELVAPMIGDGERLYAESVVHEDISASSGPVIAIGYDGSSPTMLTEEYDAPIGVAGGFLYYRHGYEAKRVPTTGGAAELLASGLSSHGLGDHAVDADYVYTTSAVAPYELRRFGAGGSNELVLAAPMGDAEFPRGAPHDLRRHGAWLYFLQNFGDGYAMLSRVRADGSSEFEQLAQGTQLTPPVFDDTGIYVAYTRGGADDPFEGVIVRIAQ